MSGQFQVFPAPDGGYRFRLVDSSGNTWATSEGVYATKQAVAAAIALVREIAGTGLIRDQSQGRSGEPIQPRIRSARTGSTVLPSAPGHSGSPTTAVPGPAPESSRRRRVQCVSTDCCNHAVKSGGPLLP
jgi:uncharacterized protein YegP (UPF0339 family)